MRLRPRSEYIAAIRSFLPTSEAEAVGHGPVAGQTAERLGLTEGELRTVRPNGFMACGLSRFANQHRSNVSALLFRMVSMGEARSSGGRHNKRYWLAPRNRYAGVLPTHDQIADRAYKLFEDRGCVHGYDQEDWLRAERELLGG